MTDLTPAMTQEQAEQLLTTARILEDKDMGGGDVNYMLVKTEAIRDLLTLNQAAIDAGAERGQSNLRDHAIRELKLLTSTVDEINDPEDTMDAYEKAVHGGVMDLLEVFIAQRHSGLSSAWTLDLLTKLARFEPLTPVTDNPAEWLHHTNPEDGEDQVWQSKRNSKLFSVDGGKTYYDVQGGYAWWAMVIPRKWRFKLPLRLLLRALHGKIYKSEPATILRGN